MDEIIGCFGLVLLETLLSRSRSALLLLGHCNTVNYRENPVSNRADDGRTDDGRAAKKNRKTGLKF